MNPQDLAKELNARRPVKLKAILQDEREQMVAMPKGRNRWARAAAVIDQLAWVEVHCLDVRNELQGIIRRAEEPTTIETIGTGGGDVAVTQAVALANIIAKAIGEAHKTATQQTAQLVEKLRGTMAGELKDILQAHRDLAANAFERALEAESELQRYLAEHHAEVEADLARKKGETTEDWRSRVLGSLLDGTLGNKGAPDGAPPNGANGA